MITVRTIEALGKTCDSCKIIKQRMFVIRIDRRARWLFCTECLYHALEGHLHWMRLAQQAQKKFDAREVEILYEHPDANSDSGDHTRTS